MDRLFTCAAAMLASACAPAGPVTPLPPPIIYPQPPRQAFSRQPARPELLDFQHYGRQIADRVAADPAFGGFIFRSDPEPHAIVMFTGNAEARLRRYTSDPRFKAKRVDITLAELERMKDRTGEQLSPLGLACWGVDADEEHNMVTVSAPPAELEKVRAAIAGGRFKPPRKFRLVAGACVVAR